MSKYRIKYNYDTGDSFNSYPNQEGYVELEWGNIDNAKANLKRIKEHYTQYKQLRDRWGKEKTNQEILNENKDKDWFVKQEKTAVFYEYYGKPTYNVIDEQHIEHYKKDKKYTIGTIIDESMAKNCIILYTDDNKPFQFWCSWCGYFEHLNFCEVEAVTPEENNMKFYA